MGGSLTGPNKIKDVYKKIVFYDDNKLKIITVVQTYKLHLPMD